MSNSNQNQPHSPVDQYTPTTSMRTPARSTLDELSGVATAATTKPLSYGLTAEELNIYAQQGYIVKRGLLRDLASALQHEADQLLEMKSLQVDGNLRFDWTSGAEPKVWKVDPFIDLAAFWGHLSRDRRIVDILASLYQGREPRLMKDKLIYKPSHSKGNALHQDYTWWQGLPQSAISVCIAVDYTTLENGATTLYPGLHKKGLFGKPGVLRSMDRALVAGVEPEVVCAEPGDVIFFGGFTPHEAGPNQTDGQRRQIFLTYNDSADGEWHKAHYDHFFSYRLDKVPLEQRDHYFFL